jgi:outer membrane protein OmpA-like peptidoglycan-associated protein
MSQLLDRAIRKIEIATATGKPSEWLIVTSSGGACNLGVILAAGATQCYLYLSKNPKDTADSPGVVKLSFTGIGRGLSTGPVDASFSTAGMPSKGVIYHGPLSTGADLELKDLTGWCAIRVTSVGYGIGLGGRGLGASGSLTEIFFRPITVELPARCKAVGIVFGAGVTKGLRLGGSMMEYKGHMRVSQVNPEMLADTPEPLNLRLPDFRRIPLALPADVLFDFDRAVLKPAADPILQNTAQFLAQQRVKSVIIEGHTDSKGTDQYNLQLSIERANAVRNWLVRNKVPNATSFVAKGVGKARPIAANTKPDGSDNPEGRRQNRRVALVLVP